MKTPDEIKKDLQHCSQRTQLHCLDCSHDGESFCTHKLTADALAYIQQLERELDTLAALYKTHGTCGTCKHNGSKICDNCTNKNNRWEWAGIKEVTP